MKRDRIEYEKALRRHLGLFGSPSTSQIEASRARIRERLRASGAATVTAAPAEVRTAGIHRAWRAGLLLATAAAAIVVVVMAPWQQTDWLATVEAADGSRYPLAPNAILRSTDVPGTMLTLKDGSRVEMRSKSELSLERAEDGIGIRLRAGDLVVNAARQQARRLYVHTKDMTIDGMTIAAMTFVVNTEQSGSRVTVVEGELRVREGTVEKRLWPGQQASTSPALALLPVKDVVGWSRHADMILAAFAKGMGDTAGPLQLANHPSPEIPAAVGQPASPEFEEASIKQCDPDNLPVTPDGGRGGGANSFQLTPGRLRALCMTTATLIRTAYRYGPIALDFLEAGRGRGFDFGNVYGLGVEDGRRVKGGPDWVRSERYTVEAVAGFGVKADAETLRGPMLQRLLSRRFQLKAHLDAEQVPAFALKVARGGLKIKPVETGACERLPARAGAPLLFGYPGSVLTPPRGFADVQRGEKPSCGQWSQRNGPNTVIVGGAVPLDALLTTLAARLGGVRVIDRTGVTGRFNFILEFAVDENTPGLPGRPVPEREADADVPPAATIYTALEEQLGLKLEPTQAAREFIVIDHVERPEPN
jgi:uncharacterized protein (TIGR03435 family)